MYNGTINSTSKPDLLGVAAEIYVVSLPHRMDRRAKMEQLRKMLSLRWSYIDAVQSHDPVVDGILHQVRNLREDDTLIITSSDDQKEFVWPVNYAEAPCFSSEPSVSIWKVQTQHQSFLPEENSQNARSTYPQISRSGTAMANLPLTCAKMNHVSGPPYSTSLPAYMLLTPAKVACWFSHLKALRHFAGFAADCAAGPQQIANQLSNGEEHSHDVAVILEDDVDMERDIRNRLQDIWGLLPAQWDIVFLGHCWSNESHYPALTSSTSFSTSRRGIQTTLHPSFTPKCTHAYAITRGGARRLLQHLNYAPFAYSRAFDQALSWLVLSGRIKAFSVVPSVVIQRKVFESDIDSGASGTGSAWKEHLLDGVLGS
ncbi:hypothetical protein WOLCODRAFT_93084 [Wolfiporia cocos MD-104 SS10]|uniref:Glycosyltransferase family 25 protein n=1 Tax=Wolfiporia cocos (strain MD-104) TaxID=742152 RepID=A0A2H3J6A8_WOLCO|nr:hypothetical protein WOLCODRAFT_93084 [Wolfiporia cocos MD-104 SS10]